MVERATALLQGIKIPQIAPSIGSFVLISICRVTGEIEKEMAVRMPSQLYTRVMSKSESIRYMILH